MACGEYGHFAVEKWQKLNFAHQYKEERRKVMLVVYALGRILILINLHTFCIRVYFVSRGYKNMSFYEKFTK